VELMQVTPLAPTTHTPPDGGSRSPLKKTGRQLVNMLGLRTQNLRLMCEKIDRITPGMLDGHSGRLDSAVAEAAIHFDRGMKILDEQMGVLDKWDRARGVHRSGDSAELRSIEDGGNG
jgi:hypothetical protein